MTPDSGWIQLAAGSYGVERSPITSRLWDRYVNVAYAL